MVGCESVVVKPVAPLSDDDLPYVSGVKGGKLSTPSTLGEAVPRCCAAMRSAGPCPPPAETPDIKGASAPKLTEPITEARNNAMN
jgi:hypothetical protein